MSGTGPSVVLDAPALTPPPNGLLNAAQVVDQTDERWYNGIQFQPESFDDVIVFDPCSTTGDVVASVNDAVTNSTTTLTSVTAKFNASDLGHTITGSGIPAGTTIAGVTNSTTITLSQAATATATGVTITITNRQPAVNGGGKLEFLPFGVQASATCSAFGWQKEDYEGRARRALAARESKGVEKEFLTGAIISVNRHLQDDTNTVKLNTSAYGLRTGLARLVQAIADNNLGIGMIHARPFLVTAWSSLQLLRWNNGKLYTWNGNLVVPGSGYTGNAPDGTAVTNTAEWAYATEAVVINRGPVVVETPGVSAENVYRGNNEVTVRAH